MVMIKACVNASRTDPRSDPEPENFYREPLGVPNEVI